MKRTEKILSHLSSSPSSSSSPSAAAPDHSFPTSPFIQGNFAPVYDEILNQDLEVIEGSVPNGLTGYYIRTGPNPAFDFENKPYEWLDGDGMMHSIAIFGNTVRYSNRFVQTKRVESDRRNNQSISENAAIRTGDFSMIHLTRDERGERMGKANTSVVCHSSKVLVLDEQDKPYLVEAKDLKTVGRYDFGGKLSHEMTAHPKIDPKTNYMYFFAYHLVRKPPFAHFAVADEKGDLVRSFPLDLRFSTMIHDCAITENFVIILECPLVFNPKNLGRGSLWDYKDQLPSRFGLLPKNSKDGKDIRWFEFDPCYIFHVYNAWEEDGKVFLFAMRYPRFYEGVEPAEQAQPHEYIFDLRTGKGRERKLNGTWGDFPSVDPLRVGRKTRFFYHSSKVIRNGEPLFNQVIKYDLEKDLILVHALKDNMVGGEFVFVPRSGRNQNDEDDGFLMGFCHHEKENRSEFYVIDAKTMAQQPLMRVSVPRRVPFGFHGNWINASDL